VREEAARDEGEGARLQERLVAQVDLGHHRREDAREQVAAAGVLRVGRVIWVRPAVRLVPDLPAPDAAREMAHEHLRGGRERRDVVVVPVPVGIVVPGFLAGGDGLVGNEAERLEPRGQRRVHDGLVPGELLRVPGGRAIEAEVDAHRAGAGGGEPVGVGRIEQDLALRDRGAGVDAIKAAGHPGRGVDRG